MSVPFHHTARRLSFASCLLGCIVAGPLHAQQALTPSELAVKQAKEERARREAAEREVKRQADEVKRKDDENQNLREELERMKREQAPKPAPKPEPKPAAEPAKEEVFKAKGVSFKMLAIPGGSFTMGSPKTEPDREEYEVQRQVSLKGFQLGQTEVTQRLWTAVMGSNPSRFKDCGDNCPVEAVSWDEVQGFIQKLNQLTGQNFRLPSEAEWEYAARAGCDTPFNVVGACRSKIEVSEANFNGDYTYNGSSKGKSPLKTLAVGSFASNSWGLHDMHGNVSEWLQDCSSDYSAAPKDGSAMNSSSCGVRIVRGGSWGGYPKWLRAADRFFGGSAPSLRDPDIGFRLARTVF